MRPPAATADRVLGAPKQGTLQTFLRDGTPIQIRPVGPDDKPILREGFERLSAVSRYRRFGRTVKELTDEQLRYFTEIDYRDHMAWLAVDLTHPGHPGLGIARYIRFKHQPDHAEVAVTVVDECQGKGLGTLLLGMLAQSSIENGINTWVAYVLTENTPMLKLFRDLGARTARVEEPGVVRLEIPVPQDTSRLPETSAGRVFRAVASEVGAKPGD